jgi:hypothetical protein
MRMIQHFSSTQPQHVLLESISSSSSASFQEEEHNGVERGRDEAREVERNFLCGYFSI